MKILLFFGSIVVAAQLVQHEDILAFQSGNAPAPTLQQASPFPIGFGINPGWMQANPLYQQTVALEGNSITANTNAPGESLPDRPHAG